MTASRLPPPASRLSSTQSPVSGTTEKPEAGNGGQEAVFVIRGEPTAKGRPRISTRSGYPVAYTPAKTRNAESDIRSQLLSQLPDTFQMFKGPLKLAITVNRTRPKHLPKRVIYPTTRPDLDNYSKIVLDSMNSIVFRDDSQIVDFRIIKQYGSPPGITIEVTQICQ